MFPSYRNQATDLLCKSIDWFLCDGQFSRYGVKVLLQELIFSIFVSRVFIKILCPIFSSHLAISETEAVARSCFAKIAFKNLAKPTEENLCWSVFLIHFYRKLVYKQLALGT